jgi:hypothetical protein
MLRKITFYRPFLRKDHFTNRISRPFTCPQTFINLSPYEGFTKYVAAFGFLSLILRFGARQFFAIWFFKALSPAQAQWVRQNNGSNIVVDAAEDYILPTISPKGSYHA